MPIHNETYLHMKRFQIWNQMLQSCGIGFFNCICHKYQENTLIQLAIGNGLCYALYSWHCFWQIVHMAYMYSTIQYMIIWNYVYTKEWAAIPLEQIQQHDSCVIRILYFRLSLRKWRRCQNADVIMLDLTRNQSYIPRLKNGIILFFKPAWTLNTACRRTVSKTVLLNRD